MKDTDDVILVVLTNSQAPPPAGAVDAQVVPLEVRTLPDVLGATANGADVPLPSSTLLAVSVVAPVPPLATGRVPVTPVVKGRPVALVITPDAGVPNAGVIKVGDVANTNAPEPVSSLTAVARFALEGVPNQVATPAPKEVIPVPPFATGSVPITPLAKLMSSSVPPSVKFPELVTVPVRVNPLTVPVPTTEVTEPTPFEFS